MKMSQLIALLAADLEANGDTENVALGVIVKKGDMAHRLDAHGPIEVSHDPNYVDGMAVLTAGEVDGTAVETFTTIDRARLFMRELQDSVETLTSIAEQHGARTLADLMYLHSAILSGGFIDYYPDESKVMDIARSLPSGEQWTRFIEVEYMAAAFDAGNVGLVN